MNDIAAILAVDKNLVGILNNNRSKKMCLNLYLDLGKYLHYKGDFSGRHYLAFKSFNMFNYDNEYKEIELYGKFRDLYKYEFERGVFGLNSIVDNKMQMVMNVLSSYLFNAELGYHGYFQRTLENRYDLYNYQIILILYLTVKSPDDEDLYFSRFDSYNITVSSNR